MHIKQPVRAITMLGFVWILLGSCSMLLADEGDARLKKRLAELEMENRSLRKMIDEIQKVLKSASESPTIGFPNSSGLRITVLPGDWGGSTLADIQKVCESAAGTIVSELPDDGFAPILVQRTTEGPITLYDRAKGYEYIVRLDTGGQAWAQLAYQFSHEFCHIVCNYRDAKNPQLWFEESLCECASLYSLQRMAVQWEVNPPYPNWKSYSISLANYARDRINQYTNRNESTAQFYRRHLADLEKNATNRDLNTTVAVKLLPHLEATPEAWQSLRYLNLGSIEENLTLQTYLTRWHGRVPEQHKPFIRQIAKEFDIELASEEQAD